MADTREQILARLLAVASGISGVETAARNVDDLDETALPAIIVQDGDEEAIDNPVAVGLAPNVVIMSPQLLILLGDVPENIGTAANSWRTSVLKAVLGDATLATFCRGARPSGVRYAGMTFATFTGRDAKAEITLNLAISYPFSPRAF